MQQTVRKIDMTVYMVRIDKQRLSKATNCRGEVAQVDIYPPQIMEIFSEPVPMLDNGLELRRASP